LPVGATKNRGPDPAHGGGCGGGFPPASALPGRRSPVDVATERRHPSRSDSAVDEIHCLCLILVSGAPSPGDGRSPAAPAEFTAENGGLSTCPLSIGSVHAAGQAPTRQPPSYE